MPPGQPIDFPTNFVPTILSVIETVNFFDTTYASTDTQPEWLIQVSE